MADEELLAISSSNVDDLEFDRIIGALEEILMDGEFQELQDQFMEKYYQEFEDTEENKLIYMDIFKEYTELLEHHIEKQLCQRINGFSMDEFQKCLLLRRDQIDLEIFDMLQTLTDFMEFKQMFLDYKAVKDGKMIDFSPGIVVLPLTNLSHEHQCEEVIDITENFS